MNENLIIDASVMVKWFIDEEYSDKAISLMESYINGDIVLYAPTLIYFEVLNALRYSKLYDSSKLELLAQTVDNFGIKMVEISEKIRGDMVKISLNHDMSIYDASYIAIAISLNTQLITADSRIRKKLPKNMKRWVLDLESLN